jgi:CRP-like cAMP-binding protein
MDPGFPHQTNFVFSNPAKPTYPECLACFIDSLKHFSFLSAADLKGLDAYWEFFSLSKNKPFVLPGEHCPYIAFICKGAMKHFIDDANGRHYIDFKTDGYFCALIPCFLHEQKAKDGVISVKNTFGVKISLPNFKKLTSERPAFAELFRLLAEEETYRVVNRLISFQSTDARGRYELLLRQNSTVFNHFTMQDIANYLGIKPETMSRLRNEKGHS